MDTTTARQEVAATVRSLMGRGIDGKRVTQAELGRVLGLSQGPVSERLAGKTAFNLDELLKIAEHFRVSIASMIVEVDELRRPSGQENRLSIWEAESLLAYQTSSDAEVKQLSLTFDPAQLTLDDLASAA